MFCPSCKAEIADGMKYCTQCGTALEANNTPSAQAGAAVRQTAQAQGVAPAAGQQAQQPTQAQQRPQQPVATSQQVVQPQFQQQPMQEKKQRPPRNTPAPKKTSPVGIIALILSIVAFGLAIAAFVIPLTNQSATPTATNAPKLVAADTTTVTIKAGEDTGRAKLFDENTPYIVVATAAGGDNTYCDVMYDQARGELSLIAKKPVEKDTERPIMWAAYKK